MPGFDGATTRGAVKVLVRAPNAEVEITIIDGSLQSVASGSGRVETELMPGSYKIRYRARTATKEDFLLVPPNPPALEIVGPEQPFLLAAPLSEPGLSHEYHEAAATKWSNQVHVNLGGRSQFFLCARDYTPRNTPVSGGNPVAGLALLSLDGQDTLASLCRKLETSRADARIPDA